MESMDDKRATVLRAAAGIRKAYELRDRVYSDDYRGKIIPSKASALIQERLTRFAHLWEEVEVLLLPSQRRKR